MKDYIVFKRGGFVLTVDHDGRSWEYYLEDPEGTLFSSDHKYKSRSSAILAGNLAFDRIAKEIEVAKSEAWKKETP